MFVPSQPILETIIRGSVTYLCLFVLLRLFRRQTGSMGPADLLVLLLIADASQNAMADNYDAITDGLILVATIVAWEYAIDYLSYRVAFIGRLIDRRPLLIINRGKVLDEHLRQILMSDDELLSQLRQKGIDDISLIKQSFMEGDGTISVIRFDRSATPPKPDRPGIDS
jgi:uncharacterized membrane protein YcaP (DUF421 family)